MRRDDIAIVDRDLRVTSALEMVRHLPPWDRVPDGTVGDDGDAGPAVALCQDGVLVPGATYPSSSATGPGFYLPSYALHTVGGRHATGLHYVDPPPPEGPLARLQVVLHEVAPDSPSPLQRIEHDVLVRLAYELPVQDGQADPPAGPEVGEAARQTLVMDLGALVPQGDGVAALTYAVQSKDELDRLFEVMSNSGRRARLELRLSATVGRRTWRQTWLDRFAALEAASLLSVRQLAVPDLVEQVLPVVPDPRFDGEPVDVTVAATLPELALSASLLRPELLAAPLRSTAFAARGALPERAALLALDPGPALRLAAREPLAVRIARSDFDTTRLQPVEEVEQVVVPVAIPAVPIVAGDGTPALLRTTLVGTQVLDPFCFDPEVNANVFDLPGDLRPGHAHVLLRDLIDLGTGTPVTVYQDSALSQQFYVEPQTFRLSRSDVPPHRPDLLMTFVDVIEQAVEGGAPTLDYRVQLTYRVVPTLDGAGLDRVEQVIRARHPDASVSLVLPQRVELTLQVPGEDGTTSTLTRTPDPALFDDGIPDTMTVDATTFLRVVALLQRAGLDGSVEAELTPAQTTTVPLRVSLTENTGARLLHAYRGPLGGGTVRVHVVNPLESPVRIDDLYRVDLAAGTHAYPLAVPGIVLPAGSGVDLDYRVDPPDADVPDLPPLLGLTVLADVASLLPRLMVNQGYATTTFPVHVSAPVEVFGTVPAGAGEPVTGLLVEFDDGTRATLDAAVPDADVALRMRLLPWLLGTDDARAWAYRVRNLYGTGSAVRVGDPGQLLDGQSASVLHVVPNPA